MRHFIFGSAMAAMLLVGTNANAQVKPPKESATPHNP